MTFNLRMLVLIIKPHIYDGCVYVDVMNPKSINTQVNNEVEEFRYMSMVGCYDQGEPAVSAR